MTLIYQNNIYLTHAMLCILYLHITATAYNQQKNTMIQTHAAAQTTGLRANHLKPEPNKGRLEH